MATVTINNESFHTTKHGEYFVHWCRHFFIEESAQKVLDAIAEDHKNRCSEIGRKVNLDEFRARRVVENLCKTEQLFRTRDGEQVFSIK